MAIVCSQAQQTLMSGTLPSGAMYQNLKTLALSRAGFTGTTEVLSSANKLETLLLSTNRFVCEAYPYQSDLLGNGSFLPPGYYAKHSVGESLITQRVFGKNPWPLTQGFAPYIANSIAVFSSNLGLTGQLCLSFSQCH